MIVAQLEGAKELRKVVVRDVALRDHNEIVIEAEEPGMRDGLGMTIEEAIQLVSTLGGYLAAHYNTGEVTA